MNWEKRSGRVVPPIEGAETSGAETWKLIEPMGVNVSSMVVDPARDRLVLYGGIDGIDERSRAVWIKPLSGVDPWTLLEVQGPSPSGRLDHTAIFDPPGGEQTEVAAGSHTWRLSLR